MYFTKLWNAITASKAYVAIPISSWIVLNKKKKNVVPWNCFEPIEEHRKTYGYLQENWTQKKKKGFYAQPIRNIGQLTFRIYISSQIVQTQPNAKRLKKKKKKDGLNHLGFASAIKST